MIDVNGTSLHYEDTGPGSSGQTLAFSHGLLWSTVQFAPQVATLRDRYRCISWDHRGQGRSAADPHREGIGVELVWQDAVALLEALAPGPVHLCGLSMGGFVAMRTAARRPDLVASLILLETSADPEPVENLARYRALTRVVRHGGRLVTRTVVRTRVAPMLGRSILADPARRTEVAGYVDVMSARRDVWRAVNGVIDRAGVAAGLPRITAPALVVVGEEDVATVPAKAERIVAALPGAQLVSVPRAGHSSTVEEPAAVTEAIRDFLAALQ